MDESGTFQPPILVVNNVRQERTRADAFCSRNKRKNCMRTPSCHLPAGAAAVPHADDHLSTALSHRQTSASALLPSWAPALSQNDVGVASSEVWAMADIFIYISLARGGPA